MVDGFGERSRPPAYADRAASLPRRCSEVFPAETYEVAHRVVDEAASALAQLKAHISYNFTVISTNQSE